MQVPIRTITAVIQSADACTALVRLSIANGDDFSAGTAALYSYRLRKRVIEALEALRIAA